jgi:hypothetical protein
MNRSAEDIFREGFREGVYRLTARVREALAGERKKGWLESDEDDAWRISLSRRRDKARRATRKTAMKVR